MFFIYDFCCNDDDDDDDDDDDGYGDDDDDDDDEEEEEEEEEEEDWKESGGCKTSGTDYSKIMIAINSTANGKNLLP